MVGKLSVRKSDVWKIPNKNTQNAKINFRKFKFLTWFSDSLLKNMLKNTLLQCVKYQNKAFEPSNKFILKINGVERKSRIFDKFCKNSKLFQKIIVYKEYTKPHDHE